VVLLGSPYEAAEGEAHPVQGYGWGVPAAQRPCDHQRKEAVPQIEIDLTGHFDYRPPVSLVVAGAVEAPH
jgi:hypothetical protein